MATGRTGSRARAWSKVALVAVCLTLAGLASSAALAQTLGDVTGQVTSTVDDILSTGADEVNSAVESTGGTSGSGSGDSSGSGSGGTSSVEDTVGGLTTSEKATGSGDSNTSAFADACGRQVGDQTFGAFMASVRDSRGGGGPSGSRTGDSQPFAGGASGAGSGNTASGAGAAPTPAQPAIPPPDGFPAWLSFAALAVLVIGLAALLALVARSLFAGRATTQTAGGPVSGPVRRSV